MANENIQEARIAGQTDDEEEIANQTYDPVRYRGPRIAEIRQRYPGISKKIIPDSLISMSDAELDEREMKLEHDYGFVQSEIRFIMKHKPSLILDQDDPAMPSAKGLNTL